MSDAPPNNAGPVPLLLPPKEKKKKNRSSDGVQLPPLDATAVATAAMATEPRKRAVKALPQSLKDVSEKNLSQFKLVCKADTKDGAEYDIAAFFEYEEMESNGSTTTKVVDLDDLTSDQLKLICKNVGGSGYSGKRKFDICRAIGSLAKYDATHADAQLEIARSKYKVTGFLCRVCNCLFHSEFRDHFFKLNDSKDRKDHEGLEGGFWLPKEFWQHIADAVGYSEPDLSDNESDSIESDLRMVWLPADVQDPAYGHLTKLFLDDDSITFSGLTANYTADWLKRKHSDLDHVRKRILYHMTKSGNGESDPYEFVDRSLKVAPSISFPEAYYYFVRCSEFKSDIEQAFGVAMDSSLRGNGAEQIADATDSQPSREGKSNAVGILKQMVESQELDSNKCDAFMAEMNANFSALAKSEKANAETKKAKTEASSTYNSFLKDYYACTNADYKQQLVSMMLSLKEEYSLNVIVPGTAKDVIAV